jgi:hypothetical protein
MRWTLSWPYQSELSLEVLERDDLQRHAVGRRPRIHDLRARGHPACRVSPEVKLAAARALETGPVLTAPIMGLRERVRQRDKPTAAYPAGDCLVPRRRMFVAHKPSSRRAPHIVCTVADAVRSRFRSSAQSLPASAEPPVARRRPVPSRWWRSTRTQWLRDRRGR